MQKRAALPLLALALNGYFAGQEGYDIYAKNRDSQYGFGDASDLHGFIGEDGLVGSRPDLKFQGLATGVMSIPGVGLVGGGVKGISKFFLFEAMRNAAFMDLVRRANQGSREKNDRYYRMRQSLADAGITVGRNGSNEGIVNNSPHAPRHVIKGYTGEQKRKLRERMIDPATGAPYQDWSTAANVYELFHGWFRPKPEKINAAANPGFNMSRRLYGHDR